MQNHLEAIEHLINWFNQNGWPEYMFEQKLRGRASVVRDDSRPGWKIVRVERHRPILGAQYIKGLPMDAFTTYYMRYAVHDDGLRIEKLEEEIGSSEIDVSSLVASLTNSEQLALTIERLGAERYQIFDQVTKYNKVVSNLDEAIVFGNEIAENNSDYISEMIDLEGNDSSRALYDDRQQDIAESMREKVEELIRELWQQRDTNNDD